MADTIFSRVVKSLWVLAAFIPVINGLGFAYIGAKKFRKEWIIEGLIYELPWFLVFLFVNYPDIAETFASIGFLLMLISIVRSIYVYVKHKDILIDRDNESNVNVEKSFSSFWVIFSILIFLNGIGLIIIGFRRNVRRWILEGALLEFLWVLYIVYPKYTPFSSFLISLSFIGLILSIIRTFMVYFEEEKMDGDSFNEGSLNQYTSPSNQPSAESKDVWIESTLDGILNSSDDEIVPEFKEYKTQVEDLKRSFESKEKNVNDLLDKRFTKEELSYGRFKSVVNEFHKTFHAQADSTLTMINLAPEYSERVDNSIKDKISLLNSLVDEMSNLIEELILNDGLPDKSDEDVNELFDKMHDLIDSADEGH